MRILIADDSPTIRYLLRKDLESWGYDVVEAVDGNGALDILTSEDAPLMAVLDWEMPGINGVEVCRRIRDAGQSQLVYILLLTTRVGEEDLVFALEQGAHDFVSKQTGTAELRARIEVGRRLVELDQLKNRFLGIAAHDLRSPLGYITGMSEIMKSGRFGPVTARQSQVLGQIVTNSQHMLTLVDDLLDIAEINSGRLTLEPRVAMLAPLVRERVDLFSLVALKKDIVVSAEIAQVPAARFDPKRITQVLDNLISNAVKFAPAGTAVNVSLSRQGPSARVSVADHGPGISATEIDRLFVEFERLSASPTGGEKSTGLGLAIARRIIDGHRGTLAVDSELGRGSVFSFTVPLADTPEGDVPPSSGPGIQPS